MIITKIAIMMKIFLECWNRFKGRKTKMDKEFEEKSKDLIEYCKTNKIPVFISGYNKEETSYEKSTLD